MKAKFFVWSWMTAEAGQMVTRYCRISMRDDALWSLIRQIAAADTASVTESMRKRPQLATEALASGATRQEAESFFLSEISHHIYAGDTALHVAAAAYNVLVVHELVTLGADIDAANRRGARPLHYAVDGGPGSSSWDPIAQARIVTKLLELGADPDSPDRNGTPPLLRAVRNRCASAVDALLRGGADPTVTNARGSTAVQLATGTTGRGGSGTAEAKDERDRIIRLLEAGGA
jgi:hypothetical protein